MPELERLTPRQKSLIIDTALLSYDAEDTFYQSPYTKELRNILKGPDTIHYKWAKLRRYMRDPANANRTFYHCLTRAIDEIYQERVPVRLQIAQFSAEHLNHFTVNSRKQILATLIRNLRVLPHKDIHISSLELMEVLNNFAINDEQKWEAILRYFEDANNRDHYLYEHISNVFASHNMDQDYLEHAREHVRNEKYNEALSNYAKIKYKNSTIHDEIGWCYKTLADKYANKMKNEWLSMDQRRSFEIPATKNYCAAYANYEQASFKDPNCKTARDDSLHKLLELKLYTQYAKQKNYLENSNSLFCCLFSRKRLDQEQQLQLFKNLEKLAGQNDGKETLVKAIVEQYEATRSFSQSKASENLVQILKASTLTVDERWQALEAYMLERQDGKYVNNGRRLYSIIDTTLATEMKRNVSPQRP